MNIFGHPATVIGVLAVAISFFSAISANATPAGETERVSVTSEGSQSKTGLSDTSALSADGRYVAFASRAADLVVSDTNNAGDIFVRDTLLGVTTRVSLTNSGTQANGASLTPGVSADGRFVSFESTASNLVARDTNGGSDIFVRDLKLGRTFRVSTDSLGRQMAGYAQYPAISADGHSVAFAAFAPNLVGVRGGKNRNFDHIFVKNISTGKLVTASVDDNGNLANSTSSWPKLNADGSIAAYASQASNLVSSDSNEYQDVFVRDLDGGKTSRVSVSGDENQASSASYFPSISGDGNLVVFPSNARNLVGSDTNGEVDIFSRDITGGTTERVSVGSDETEANDGSHYSIAASPISSNGRYVAFNSFATNLVQGDTNDKVDIFLRDLIEGTTTRVSVGSDGSQSSESSSFPAINSDGKFVSFDTLAPLVGDDTNGGLDVYLHRR